MKNTKYIMIPLIIFFFILLTNCSGGSDKNKENDPIEVTPSYTPTNSDDLSSLVINTCHDNKIDITVDPTYIDFNNDAGELEINDNAKVPFAIQNNSGESQTYHLNLNATSSGFSILNENEINTGNWENAVIENGGESQFYAKYSAPLFGTQTSYITISFDTGCYIRLPMRATVSGAADFRIVPSGYLCSDSDAPEVDAVDFYAVGYNQTYTQSIKVCNNGGEDIRIESTTIENSNTTLTTAALDMDITDDLGWTTSETISSAFAFGLTPTFTSSFVSPNYINYDKSIDNPAGDYSIQVQHSGKAVQDLLVEAGKILTLDLHFTPSIDAQAPAGSIYNPTPMNALLTLDTSMGEIQIPLLGATTFSEPFAKLSYRTPESEVWKEIDLNSKGSAIYFDAVKIFLDWVTTGYNFMEIKIENVGTSKELTFFGGDITGYFEYYWPDTEEALQFPITLPGGSEDHFFIRYFPTPETRPEEAYWDFGQFPIQHNGANGPTNIVTLVGEQETGYAVQLKLGGAYLNREYADDEYKTFCVFKLDDGSGETTDKTFTVINNNQQDTLNVSWSVEVVEGDFLATQPSGNLTVGPGEEGTFTVNFMAGNTTDTLKGILHVHTDFGTAETQYSSYTSDLESRDFDVNFKAKGSDSGTSSLCSGEVLGVIDTENETDTTDVTLIVNNIVMGLTSLTESTRAYPSTKFHMKLKIDKEKGTVIAPEMIQPVYDTSDPSFSHFAQLMTPLHQATNNGCPVLPGNPYRDVYEKGSWTGDGYECVIDYTDPMNGVEHEVEADHACMPDNMAEDYTDSSGVTWKYFYHDFFWFDTSNCTLLAHGKIATFAYRPDTESVIDILQLAEESPNENEAFYESLFKAYQGDSYIKILSSSLKSECGGSDFLTDPDLVKDCYLAITGKSDAIRTYGFVDECAHFYYIFGKGEEGCDLEDPDHTCVAAGSYEPHVGNSASDNGVVYDTKYDLTIYNWNVTAFMIRAGDRTAFFGHPSHLLYANFDVTITTKMIAEPEWENDGDQWLKRIAVSTRPHVSKNQIFLEDGKPYDIGRFWTNDGKSSELCNVVDCSNLEYGVDYGGYGRGNFRYLEGSNQKKIIVSGWPINYDENNLVVMTGVGKFAGQGNTAPSFAKADASTGKGKVLTFTIFGCLVAGDPDENQGCFDYKLDDATMPSSSDLVIDQYTDYGMLPSGYPENPSDCSKLADPGFTDTDEYKDDPYLYLPCINYKINDIDRDRYKNYYDSNKFIFESDPYGSSKCGYGM